MNSIEKTLSISVRGASHIERDKPLQDYSLAVKGENMAIAIVCDGHGADKHFRSEIGSKLAAIVTEEILTKFYESNNTYDKFINNINVKLERLKLAIITNWQIKIEEYTKNNPFTKEELDKSSTSFAIRKSFDVSQAYGTTLLAVLVSEDYYLALMIGDGSIIKIQSGFNSSKLEFEGKETYDDAPHSLTDSLCGRNAFNKIFVNYEKIKLGEPLAFALCSDGLSEAFINDRVLFAKINNYLNYYADEGLEKAIDPIVEQLNEISKRSPMKDDISLAFATTNLAKFKSPSEEDK